MQIGDQNDSLRDDVSQAGQARAFAFPAGDTAEIDVLIRRPGDEASTQITFGYEHGAS